MHFWQKKLTRFEKKAFVRKKNFTQEFCGVSLLQKMACVFVRLCQVPPAGLLYRLPVIGAGLPSEGGEQRVGTQVNDFHDDQASCCDM